MASSRRSGTNEAVASFGGASRHYTSVSTWETETDNTLTSAIYQFTISNHSAAHFHSDESLSFSSSGATGTCRGVSADQTKFYCTIGSGTPTTADTITGGTTGATCDIDSIDSTNTGVSPVLECYDDSASYTCSVYLSGATTSTSYFRHIRAASTARHGGVPGAGVKLVQVSSTSAYALNTGEANFKVSDVEILYAPNTASGIWAIGTGSNGSGMEWVGLLVKATNAGDGTADGISISGGNQDYVVANCIVYECEGFGIQTRGASSRIVNCTAVGCGTYGFTYNTAAGIWKNDIGQNNTSGDFNGTGATGSDYNLSKDATAPGANSKTSKTLTFVDAANDDYRLAAADTDAIGAGVDLSGDTWAFDDDIAYTVRS